jgi:short subunit fatty acids transporter
VAVVVDILQTMQESQESAVRTEVREAAAEAIPRVEHQEAAEQRLQDRETTAEMVAFLSGVHYLRAEVVEVLGRQAITVLGLLMVESEELDLIALQLGLLLHLQAIMAISLVVVVELNLN